jgi:hypothetical protein
MSESVIGKAEGIVKSYPTEIDKEPSLTVERYAAAYRLHAADLAALGLKTIEDGIAIPYRDRDGQEVNERLLCSLGKPSRTRRTEGRAGLYGLDSLPAMGAPLFLVAGEPSCHTLWHYGIDAIAVPTAYDFDPARDDRDIEGFDLTVLLDPGQDGDVLIERLSPSRHRYDIRVGRLSVLSAHADRGELLGLLAAAREGAEPLDAVPMANPELDRLTYPERIEIQVKAGERPRVVDETIAVIQQSGRLYERGGELVRLCQQTAIPVDEAWLGDFLSRRIAFFRCKSSKENEGEFIRFEVDPPSWLAKVINAKRGERGLHELAGVITAPTLRPDGGLLTRPGFDEATGLLLRPGRWPKVPLDPDRDALHAAWQTLWMPVKELPYATIADRGVTAAAQLTAIVRRILPKAPAFSFDAPLAGSGKTLLATCIAELAGGAIAAVPECREEDELRKRLLAALRDAQPTLLLDNIKGHFASSALEAFLTDDYYSDRVLSASQMLRLPTNVLVLISGNNFIPRGDLWRRILTARIDPKVENVERRCFALEPRKYCRENRQGLVAVGLTLLRGFIAAGMPVPRRIGWPPSRIGIISSGNACCGSRHRASWNWATPRSRSPRPRRWSRNGQSSAPFCRPRAR